MNKSNKGQEGGIAILIAVIVFVAVIFVLAAGYDSVEANHLGVMVKMGQVQGIMQPGMRWTGMFTSVENYNLRMRQMTVNMQGAEAAVDKDGQSVYATIDINYRLNPASVQDAYTKIGVDSNLEKTLNIEGIIKEGFKTTTSKHTSTEIWQNRETIKQEAIKKISENFPAEYFTLDNVVVTNLDYNEAFKNAIEQQKVNEKLALSKEAEVKIAQFEADKTIQNARGAAESKKLNAEAEAYVVLTQAKAEAEGLSLKKAQLTPLMVYNNIVDKWSGNYPTYYFVTNGANNNLIQMPIPEVIQEATK